MTPSTEAGAFAPPIIAAIFVYLAWARSIKGGRRRVTVGWKLFFGYGFVAVTAIGYLIIWQGEIDRLLWQGSGVILAIAVGVGLIFAATRQWEHTED